MIYVICKYDMYLYYLGAIGASVSASQAKAFVSALRANSASVGGTSDWVSAISIIIASASQSGSRVKMDVAEDCPLRQDYFRISSSGSFGCLSSSSERNCPSIRIRNSGLSNSGLSCGGSNFRALGID